VASGQVGASGVAQSGDGRWLTVAVTTTDEATFTNTASGVNLLGPGGARVYADTLEYSASSTPPPFPAGWRTRRTPRGPSGESTPTMGGP
jgi:hypothetical protein